MIAVDINDPRLQEILNLDLPLALIGVECPGVFSVTIDDVSAARLATQHLVNLGHQRIAMIIGTDSDVPSTAQLNREAGFREAVTAANFDFDPSLSAFGHFTIEGGEAAMTALLANPNPPTAVFAFSDEMAFGALRSLRAHGLRPGVDISVVGVDGHDMANHLELSTVVQPVTELGRIATRSLLMQVGGSGEPLMPQRLTTQLVVRGSTGPLLNLRS